MFTRRTDAEAECEEPPDVKSWPIGKDPGAGEDTGQKEKEATGWNGLDGIIDSMHMSLSKLREISEGQGSLAFCSPWGSRVEHDIAMEQQQQCQSGQDGEASSDSQTFQQVGWVWPGNTTKRRVRHLEESQRGEIGCGWFASCQLDSCLTILCSNYSN